jgi:hypothetical protein
MALLTKVLFSGVCIAVILYGIIDVLTNYEQNRCHMTYMFEQPEYLVRISFTMLPPFAWTYTFNRVNSGYKRYQGMGEKLGSLAYFKSPILCTT